MRAAALVTLLGLTLVTGLASGQDKHTDAGQTYLKYCASWETGAIRQSDLERVARQQMVDLLEHLSRIQEK